MPQRPLHCTYLKRDRYIGKERDEETGLYYIGARYYCPWLARWCAVDPINSEWYNFDKGNPARNAERQHIELTNSSYEYCYANPVRFEDPSGEQVAPQLKSTLEGNWAVINEGTGHGHNRKHHFHHGNGTIHGQNSNVGNDIGYTRTQLAPNKGLPAFNSEYGAGGVSNEGVTGFDLLNYGDAG